MSLATNKSYAGDLSAQRCYDALQASDAILIDVRTKAEWAFVGVPDLAEIGGTPIFLEWQIYPEMNLNSQFVDTLSTELNKRTLGFDTPLYFLCRSGVRSASAAAAMTKSGYRQCFNVSGGFEGPANDSRHRGQTDGWKASDLPWFQS
ncbi:MAG: rhodanese-like domain-containing protein [Stappiaceae bacterium]